MQKTLVCLLALMSYACFSYAQQLDLSKKQTKAFRTEKAPEIDGELTEMDWQNAPIATDLVELQPVAGDKPTHKTEIKVMYDNSALYVGAMMYDTAPDSILQQVTQRDEIGNSDWFGIFIDPYKGGINGVSFIVTAAGAQFDAKYSVFGEDENWDAVWKSAVKKNAEGWVVEMRIPYGAIRFPNQEEQVWGLNFGRLIQRYQEKSFWSKIDPNQNGFLNQFGQISNISNIKSPFRLSATPFVAVYGENYKDKNATPSSSWGRSFNAGMDVKYGINDAFTLDMTLIPDFGQARSDNQVLNLSPFEVRFDENRQFFTEGLELFNKGGLFYSRRVGGRPLNFWDVEGQLGETEEIIDNPNTTQLINASKVSGRTTKGLGIGVFNAVSASTQAKIRDTETGEERSFETSPLTNYNVTVFDQNLKNNSYATLINTNVTRFGDAYDANVTGGEFELRNKKNSYSIRGRGALSQKYYTDRTDLGHRMSLGVRKTNGKIAAGIFYNQESDDYDPNDLGFLNNNNERSYDAYVEYNENKPFGIFNSGGVGFSPEYSRLYKPNVFTDFSMNFWAYGQTKKFWRFSVFTYHEPVTTYDYFEARTEGRFYRFPTNHMAGWNVWSDRRKKLAFGFYGNFRKFNEEGRKRVFFGFEPRYRVNDKLNFSWEITNFIQYNNVGFVNKIGDNDEEVIFGIRDRKTLENIFNTNYNFNPNMALTFRMRHYWSRVMYQADDFYLLEQDGTLGHSDYTDNHDNNFNAFTIDMVYRWRFAPGSDIFIVWKNSIFNSGEDADIGFGKNLDELWTAPQSNSLSLKVVYYLDYDLLSNRG